MSVQLIVVALLAATITTTAVSAERAKVATQLVCKTHGCDCSDPERTNFKVGQCLKRGDDYHKVADCTVGEGFSVGIFRNPACKPWETIYKDDGMCGAIAYDGATCDGDTITLRSNCPTNECNSDSCDSLSIASSDTTTCFKWGNAYYKLSAAVNCADTTGEIAFKKFEDDDTCSGEGEDAPIKKACTPVLYGKGVCKEQGAKATITFCTDCSDCSTSTFDVEVGKENKRDDETYFVESCEDGKGFTLQQHRQQTIAKDCVDDTMGGSSYKGICTTATATATIPTATSTTTTTATAASTSETNVSGGTDGGNNGGDGGNNGGDGGNNGGDGGNNGGNGSGASNNTTDEISSAPAHSVGVLALALCLLACAY